jgi:hypothetical protein
VWCLEQLVCICVGLQDAKLGTLVAQGAERDESATYRNQRPCVSPATLPSPLQSPAHGGSTLAVAVGAGGLGDGVALSVAVCVAEIVGV